MTKVSATIIHQTDRNNFRVYVISGKEVVSNRLFATAREAEDYVAEAGIRHVSHVAS